MQNKRQITEKPNILVNIPNVPDIMTAMLLRYKGEKQIARKVCERILLAQQANRLHEGNVLRANEIVVLEEMLAQYDCYDSTWKQHFLVAVRTKPNESDGIGYLLMSMWTSYQSVCAKPQHNLARQVYEKLIQAYQTGKLHEGKILTTAEIAVFEAMLAGYKCLQNDWKPHFLQEVRTLPAEPNETLQVIDKIKKLRRKLNS